jgi:hypothetical protein
MSSEHEKGAREVTIFEQFVKLSGMPVDPRSIEKREPPEPDILCTHVEQGCLAFELVELCDSTIAQLVSRARDGQSHATWTRDPSREILTKKLSKPYRTTHPIDLLCYTDGRIITPDDVILPTLRPMLDCWSGVFRQVWLLAETRVYLVWREA